jgi:hypothetical protein
MEPSNCPTIEGRAEAIRQGILPLMEPGETRRYRLRFQVLTGAESIDAAVASTETANTRIGDPAA